MKRESIELHATFLIKRFFSENSKKNVTLFKLNDYNLSQFPTNSTKNIFDLLTETNTLLLITDGTSARSRE